MVVYLTTRPVESRAFLLDILQEYGGIDAPRILLNAHGKPCLQGNETQFSLSHSGGMTAVALSGHAVGLDLETPRRRSCSAILRRLTQRERREDFLLLWTAKEAYVKWFGGTLAALLPRLRFEDGTLLLDGTPVPVPLWQRAEAGFTLSLVGEGVQNAELLFV